MRVLAGLLACCAPPDEGILIRVAARLGTGLPVLSNSGRRVITARRKRSLQLRVQLRIGASLGYDAAHAHVTADKHEPDSLLIHPFGVLEPAGVCERT